MVFHNTLKRFIYRNRLMGKQLISAANAVLPRPISRRLRAAAEQLAFRVVPEYQGDTLPPIFHFWSNRYVRPVVERIGFDTPEDLYYVEIRNFALAAARPVSVLSLGSGGCSLELALGARLRAEGIAVHFECVDFNAYLMEQGRAKARAAGLADMFDFRVADCNEGVPTAPKDVIVVNQFFHHIEKLEVACAGLKEAMAPAGLLLTCDIVGRNGHVLWPSVDERVQKHWQSLEAGRRFDRHFGKRQTRYRSVDHAAYSNEGVRAQDIVQCLSEHFDFELFVTFGGAIVPFVERRIGFNFDPESPEDTAFIDKVAVEDQAAIRAGEYPASSMIAVLRHRGRAARQCFVPVSPVDHIAMTQLQKRLAQRDRNPG